MAFYKLKEPVIEARKLTRDNVKEIIEWIGVGAQLSVNRGNVIIGVSFPTPNEARVYAAIGNYIIKGEGFSKMTDEDFQAKYWDAEVKSDSIPHAKMLTNP